jgi:hypothetical protein
MRRQIGLPAGFKLSRRYAIDRRDERCPAFGLTQALERVSTLAWQGHQFDVALHFAEEAATLARRHDRPGKLALTLNLLGRILIEQGDYARLKRPYRKVPNCRARIRICSTPAAHSPCWVKLP